MKTTAYCRVTAVQKSKGHSASAKIAYIERSGRYKNKPGLVATGRGNLPPGFDNFHQFWSLADKHERANSVTAREFMIDLPDHLNMADALKIAQIYAEKATVCTETNRPLPYSYAVHANENGHQRHMHLVMSERIIDGIERDPETFFKQQIKKTPERGGAPKLTNTASSLKKRTEQVKRFIETVSNRFLKANGIDMTVDFKRTVKHGKRPQIKLTPKEWGVMKSGKYQTGTSKRIDEFIATDRHNAQVQLMIDDYRSLNLEIKRTERTIEQQAQEEQQRAQEAQAAREATQQAREAALAAQQAREAEEAKLFEQQEAQAIADNERLLAELEQEERAAQKAQAQPTEQERQKTNVNAWASRLTGSARAGMNNYLNARGEEADAAGWVDAKDYLQQQEEQNSKNQNNQRQGPKL